MGLLRTVIGTYDGAVVGYEVGSSMPKPILAETAHMDYVSAICAGDSSLIASAGAERIRFFDMEKGMSLGELSVGSGNTCCLTFFGVSGSGSDFLLRVSSEGRLQVWRVKDRSIVIEHTLQRMKGGADQSNRVISAALDPTNPVSLLVLFSNGDIIMYDVHTGKRIKSLLRDSPSAFKISWSSDGRFAVLLGDKICHLLDFRQGIGTQIQMLNSKDTFSSVAAARDFIALGTTDGNILLYRIFIVGTELHAEAWLQLQHPRSNSLEPSRVKALCLAQPPDELSRLRGLLIAANAQGDVSFWRLSTREGGVCLKSVIPTSTRITSLGVTTPTLKSLFAGARIMPGEKPRLRIFLRRNRYKLRSLARFHRAASGGCKRVERMRNIILRRKDGGKP